MDEPVIHFRTEPGHAAPSAIRLRRLLKVALRSFGFRCVAIRPPGSVAQASPAVRPTTDSPEPRRRGRTPTPANRRPA